MFEIISTASISGSSLKPEDAHLICHNLKNHNWTDKWSHRWNYLQSTDRWTTAVTGKMPGQFPAAVERILSTCEIYQARRRQTTSHFRTLIPRNSFQLILRFPPFFLLRHDSKDKVDKVTKNNLSKIIPTLNETTNDPVMTFFFSVRGSYLVKLIRNAAFYKHISSKHVLFGMFLTWEK